tara:strand:- start:1060 stop:1170 length:111 start_codon:yes stop_codon:yes gene_type:complete
MCHFDNKILLFLNYEKKLKGKNFMEWVYEDNKHEKI